VAQALKSETNNKDLERCGTSLLLYGYGDGGGGPQRPMLDRLARITAGLPGIPVVKHGTPSEFFQEVEKSWEKLCTWRGELYFEMHRGTYTSQARNKLWNRQSENTLRNLEMVATAASLFRGVAYPWDQLDRIWKLVLLNQFHDIIPGSSIQLVYKDSTAVYADVFATASTLMDTVCNALLGRVYNTLSWDRKDVMEVDDDGALPRGILQRSAATSKPIVVATAPALGWATTAAGIAVDDATVSTAACCTVPVCGNTEYVNRWSHMSHVSSGAFGDLSSDSLMTLFRVEYPYLQLFSTETPNPYSERSPNLCPLTSNLAKSHDVLKCVGRSICPN
jgi:hypothetical protein